MITCNRPELVKSDNYESIKLSSFANACSNNNIRLPKVSDRFTAVYDLHPTFSLIHGSTCSDKATIAMRIIPCFLSFINYPSSSIL